MDNIKVITIPKVEDYRGNLAIIEKETIPFPIKRVYYLYDVPSGAYRGAHAHKELDEFLVALSGSFDVLLDDGISKKRFMLNKPDQGLLVPTGIWRELENFSSGAVCLVVASEEFIEDDYIRDYKDFLKYKNS
jgi:oxalate decarboxylase/phosphoglucose isomerase-like protein (cupin superfamily)